MPIIDLSSISCRERGRLLIPIVVPTPHAIGRPAGFRQTPLADTAVFAHRAQAVPHADRHREQPKPDYESLPIHLACPR
jgi:hypothetical protein